MECHFIWQCCGKRVSLVVLWLLEYAYQVVNSVLPASMAMSAVG